MHDRLPSSISCIGYCAFLRLIPLSFAHFSSFFDFFFIFNAFYAFFAFFPPFPPFFSRLLPVFVPFPK